MNTYPNSHLKIVLVITNIKGTKKFDHRLFLDNNPLALNTNKEGID